jgi:hypothetical protein
MRSRAKALAATLVLAAVVVPATAFGALGDFSQPSTSPEFVGPAPFSVASGNFNGDAHTDLATASFGSSDVSILLGTGNGDFATALSEDTDPSTATQTGPSSVATGNFNGDAFTDIAAANADTDNLTILLGDGTGNFTAQTPEDTAGEPLNVVVGSFDGDANQDLAVTSPTPGGSVVTILLGDGTGDFDEAVTSPEVAAGNARASVAANFNGDANQDLAVAARDSDEVHVLLGDGTGNFNAATPVAVPGGPTALAAAHLDGDANTDLAVSNEDGFATILLGAGNGSFGAPSTETAGSGPHSIVAANLGGNASADLAVANTGSGNVTILIGDGTGDFTQPASSPVASGPAPWWLTAADLDGGGGIDLAVANEGGGPGGNSVSVLLNDAGSPIDPPAGPGPGTPATPTPAKKCKKKKKKKGKTRAAASAKKCKKKKKKKK